MEGNGKRGSSCIREMSKKVVNTMACYESPLPAHKQLGGLGCGESVSLIKGFITEAFVNIPFVFLCKILFQLMSHFSGLRKAELLE